MTYAKVTYASADVVTENGGRKLVVRYRPTYSYESPNYQLTIPLDDAASAASPFVIRGPIEIQPHMADLIAKREAAVIASAKLRRSEGKYDQGYPYTSQSGIGENILVLSIPPPGPVRDLDDKRDDQIQFAIVPIELPRPIEHRIAGIAGFILVMPFTLAGDIAVTPLYLFVRYGIGIEC